MPEPQLFLAHEYSRIGRDRYLRQQFEAGELVRITTGAYAERGAWSALDEDARYRLLVTARALLAPGIQFSHDSAAAMWRLPTFGPWSTRVHAVAERAPGGRSKVGIQRHCIGTDPEAQVIDGVLITSLARTIIAAASQPSFTRAVCMVDDGLRPARRGEFRHQLGTAFPTAPYLLRMLHELEPFPGSVRAARVLDFASPLSDSPGESVSRVNIHALGFPAPELQVKMFDAVGLIGVADFYWPEFDLVGEFDGDTKYGDQRRFDRGLSLRELLDKEKWREVRFRRVVRSVARWDWKVAKDRRALGELLRSEGLKVSGRARS